MKNELRIGNYIKDRGDKIWQIDHWECYNKVSAKSNILGYFDDENTIPIMSHPLTEYVEFLQPIPLTEEWLLKFGFELFSSGSYCKNLITDSDVYLAFDLKYNNGFCWLNIQYGKVENTTKISCSYIHQLQNLYYALTGEELTITE